MGLREKEPLEEGLRESNSIALPHALWEALNKEWVIEGAKSRSSFITDLLIFGVKEVRARREKAAAEKHRK